MIPYGKQEITQDDINAVVEALNSPLITQGPKAGEFESGIANYTQAKFGVSFNSATSALHCALLALGVRKHDFVWCAPITFVASTNAALYCDAKVDFVDIDKKTYNIDTKKLEKKLKNTKKHKLPKVVVCVHFAGQSCDMKEIFRLSKIYDFKILEDASHALGGEYDGTKIGSCKYSDIAIFSFHPVKIITSAEGGVATTNSQKYAAKMQMLKNHGITKENFENKPHGSWYYEQQILGYNYRLSELHAALGLSQLKRLDSYINRRNEIAKIYDDAFKDLELTTPFVESQNKSAFHLYVILLNKNSGIKRKALFDKLLNCGIAPQVHYIPVHLQPFYERFGFKKGDFKVAEKYYKNAITIPLYPTLSEAEINKVIEIIKQSVAKRA